MSRFYFGNIVIINTANATYIGCIARNSCPRHIYVQNLSSHTLSGAISTLSGVGILLFLMGIFFFKKGLYVPFLLHIIRLVVGCVLFYIIGIPGFSYVHYRLLLPVIFL